MDESYRETTWCHQAVFKRESGVLMKGSERLLPAGHLTLVEKSVHLSHMLLPSMSTYSFRKSKLLITLTDSLSLCIEKMFHWLMLSASLQTSSVPKMRILISERPQHACRASF